MAATNELYDGFVTLEGGMDSGRAPELIEKNQVAFSVNTTFRGGYAKSRPGIRQPAIGFDSMDSKTWFTTNRVQGAGYYNIDGSTPVIIVGVGGKIFEKRMSGTNAYIQDITPVYPKDKLDVTGVNVGGQVDRNSMRQPKVWMCQADSYFVIQDGLGKAIIYDGATARRAGSTEVPVGTCMAYGLGRLVVAQGNQFVVGDILGGATTVVSFTETNILNEGGAFSLPAQMGNIVGMTFIARQDTATGQGILLVFAERGVASVDLSQPRTSWKSSAIQQVAILGVGATSDGSIVLINDDVFWRATDGIRSYRNTNAQFGLFPMYSAGGNYGRTPISYEVKRILDYDTPGLLSYVSAVYFDNRYLMTVSPKANQQGAVFRGLAVMDFVPVTSTQKPATACFDGLWTGFQPVELVTGNYPEGDRCFAICTDDNDGNEVWEITKNGTFDNDDPNCPIQSFIEPRALTFDDLWHFKKFLRASITVGEMIGTVNFSLSFRPDQYPLWTPWHNFTIGKPSETCTSPGICQTPPMIPPQYRCGLIMPDIPDACAAGSQYRLNTGFSILLRIGWTGHASINRLLVNAVDFSQPRGACV